MNKQDYDAFAVTKYLRISASKVRKVADEIRGKNVEYALKYLPSFKQRGAKLIFKTLNSAYYNAKYKKDLDLSNLIIKAIMINEGKIIKRFQARARGRGYQIQKKTCHIKIGLKSISGVNDGTKS